MNFPKAIIFDFFGTLVANFVISEYEETLRRMASALEAAPDFFQKHWFDTFTLRATGALPTVRSNIELVCQRLNFVPPASAYDEAIRIRYAFARS